MPPEPQDGSDRRTVSQNAPAELRELSCCMGSAGTPPECFLENETSRSSIRGSPQKGVAEADRTGPDLLRPIADAHP